MMLKEFHMWAFLGENLSPVWVKNEKKKVCFQASNLTPKAVFPKSKIFSSHSLLTHYVSLQIRSFIFYTEINQGQNKGKPTF